MAWQPDYLDASQLKAALRITNSSDDAEIGFAISAASRAIDDYCGRQFGKLDTPAARYYAPPSIPYRGSHYGGRYRHGHLTAIDDLMDTTGLAVATDDGQSNYSNTLTLDTDFRLYPWNAAADNKPWTAIANLGTYLYFPYHDKSIQITARWGWNAIPAVVTQATLIQAARFFKRKDAPFGVAGSPETGSELRLLARLDPDVAVLLSGVRRLWGAA